MSSRSSSRHGKRRLPVGRVAGHRGARGELTVRGCSQPETWLGVRRFWIGEGAEGRSYEVERSRAYRDRLVLKLGGIDDANAAAGLRGRPVAVAREDAPDLPAGVHYTGELVGMLVVDESGHELGRVENVLETGGADVLQVRLAGAGRRDAKEDRESGELLIPLAGDFVLSVDEVARRIDVRVPDELRELNRPRGASG